MKYLRILTIIVLLLVVNIGIIIGKTKDILKEEGNILYVPAWLFLLAASGRFILYPAHQPAPPAPRARPR